MSPVFYRKNNWMYLPFVVVYTSVNVETVYCLLYLSGVQSVYRLF